MATKTKRSAKAGPKTNARRRDVAAPLCFNPAETGRLFNLWLKSDCKTLGAFAAELSFEPEAFRRATKGWASARDLLNGACKLQGPDGGTASRKLTELWWTLVAELEAALNTPGDEAELKRLAAVAGVLKTAHAGLGQLIGLGEQPELSPFVIEGIHVDAL